MPGDALGRLMIASVERQPTPPRRIAYMSAVMATLRELTMQVLLLLGIAWAAGCAAIAVSGPPEYRVPAGASMLLGLACAAIPLLLAWTCARTIRSGVVTPAVVESVEHFVPDSFTTWEAIRNVVAHGSWRLPDGQVESFQIREEWAAGLRPGSVVDLLVGPTSVLILGPHPGTEPAPALPPAEASNP
jgi:hypothetical protein